MYSFSSVAGWYGGRPVAAVWAQGVIVTVLTQTRFGSFAGDPMTNEPPGTTTISGHSRQSRNTSPAREYGTRATTLVAAGSTVALLAGLGLNRAIPERSVLMERVLFMGSSLFIPIFPTKPASVKVAPVQRTGSSLGHRRWLVRTWRGSHRVNSPRHAPSGSGRARVRGKERWTSREPRRTR